MTFVDEVFVRRIETVLDYIPDKQARELLARAGWTLVVIRDNVEEWRIGPEDNPLVIHREVNGLQ